MGTPIACIAGREGVHKEVVSRGDCLVYAILRRALVLLTVPYVSFGGPLFLSRILSSTLCVAGVPYPLLDYLCLGHCVVLM